MKNFRPFYVFLLSLLLLPFLKAFSNTGPVITRVKPENNVTDTITIVKGQTINFQVSGTDADGNMRGIEWYNNDFIGADSFTPTGSKTMTKTITFNTTGNYSVACVAYDALNAYGNGITWKVKVVDFIRTAYIDWGDEVVGVARAEDSLFSWAQRNSIKGLSLYLTTRTMQLHHAEMNTFIGRAKTKGINEVGFVIGNGTTDLTAALSYYDDPAVTNKFTGLVTEIEYWGGNYETELNAYIQVVTDMKTASNARTPGFKVESYMGGGLSQNEADRLCAVIDKILLVCYTASVDPNSVYYTYRQTRLQYFLNAAATKNRKVEIVPLFSLEPNFQGGQSLSTIDNSWYGGFTTDNTLTNKYMKGILSGAQYFTYYYMNPNKLYAPRQYNHFGVGYPGGDTIKVELGGTVPFKTDGNDQNGDFSGADWYVNNVLHGQESITPVVAGSARHNITFSTAGFYTVEARTKDATGLYTPLGYLYKTVAQVTADSVNLAKDQSASQSTTAFGGVASRAVDGNPNSSWAGGSISHTSDSDPATQAWWQVDLGAIKDISTIRIFNRTDCCSDRLSNFHIFVSDVPFTSNTVSGTQAQTGVMDIPYSGTLSDAGIFTANRTGRYVRIQLTTAGTILHLAEVKVFQAPGSPLRMSDINRTAMVAMKTSEQKKMEQVRLYPNPVTTVLYVDVPEKAVLQIVSMSGTIMSTPVVAQGNRIAIHTDQLPTGMYLLKVQLARSQTLFKFVKE